MNTTRIMQWHPVSALSDCWDLMKLGIEYAMLRDEDVQRLLAQLRKGHDLVVEELGFEFLGEDLRVSFRDEQCRCDPHAFVTELETPLTHGPA